VTEVLIRPLPGDAATVARELRGYLARAWTYFDRRRTAPAGRGDRADRQSTALFSAIAVMISFLPRSTRSC
jgi:hypothetical protein